MFVSCGFARLDREADRGGGWRWADAYNDTRLRHVAEDGIWMIARYNCNNQWNLTEPHARIIRKVFGHLEESQSPGKKGPNIVIKLCWLRSLLKPNPEDNPHLSDRPQYWKAWPEKIATTRASVWGCPACCGLLNTSMGCMVRQTWPLPFGTGKLFGKWCTEDSHQRVSKFPSGNLGRLGIRTAQLEPNLDVQGHSNLKQGAASR